MKRPEYLVVITGLSGSGKSYVQSTLEDLGFYCVDNLPIELIEAFLDEVGTHIRRRGGRTRWGRTCRCWRRSRASATR